MLLPELLDFTLPMRQNHTDGREGLRVTRETRIGPFCNTLNDRPFD